MWHKVSLSLLTRILHYDKLTYKMPTQCFTSFPKNLLNLSKMLVLFPLKLMDLLYKATSYWVTAIHKQILMEYMLPQFKLQTYIKPIASSHNTPEINRLISWMFKSLFLPCKPDDISCLETVVHNSFQYHWSVLCFVKKKPSSSNWVILSMAVHTIHGYEYPPQTHAIIVHICFSKLPLGGNQKYCFSKISLTTLTNCF